MRKRKGSLYTRMLAVLLSAVLLAGTMAKAFPVSAWAKESDKAEENGDGNTAKTGEGSITAEEGKPEEGTDSDGHDGKTAADAGDAEDATGAVNAANAEGATDAANGANTVYAAGTVNLPDAADMPNAVTIAEDAGTANATWNVTLHVHGYDAGKWKGIKTSHNDKIEEISQSCEEKPGQGYTDFTYTFEVNMKASTGWEQFELYYNHSDSVAKIIRKTIIIGENGREEVNVWPVRFMNDDKVFDIIYVGEAQGINRGPETSPEKSGYTFSGWVTSDGEPAFQDDEFGMEPAWIWITGETNFYASWTHTHDLVLKDAKNAACTEAGNQAYYVCNICDQWFSDAAGTQEIMNHDSVVIPAAGHSYDISQWGYRWADGHAHKCQNCNAYDTVSPHKPGAAATETMPQTCTECGYELAPATGESHTHNYGDWQHDSTQHWKVCACGDETDRGNHNFGDWVTDKEATATETGTKHRDCQTCSYTETGTIPATGESHTHNYGGWQHDNTQHWKVCSCGDETDRGNHIFGDWVTDKEATVTETGMRHKECRICHYRVTETIPAAGTDPGSGTVTPEVKPGANAPATNISTPTEELEDMLLTEEEKQQVQNGTNVRIVLEVQDAGSTVSAGDKENIKQALSGFTVGQYLNIDLYKLVGANRTDITETAKKIRTVITVPNGLKNTDSSKIRTFAVIRVHNGKAKYLPDLDSSPDTITIETDRFSTYAVVYQDTNPGGDTPGTGDTPGGDTPGTGDTPGGDNPGTGDTSGSDGSSGDGAGVGNNGGDSENAGSGSTGAPAAQDTAQNTAQSQARGKDNEPKTGDDTPLMLCATLAMIAGLSYVILYFTERRGGMSEETKKEFVSRFVKWAKRGGRIRKCLALAAIFGLLVYYHGTRKLYHGIGRKTCAGRI